MNGLTIFWDEEHYGVFHMTGISAARRDRLKRDVRYAMPRGPKFCEAADKFCDVADIELVREQVSRECE